MKIYRRFLLFCVSLKLFITSCQTAKPVIRCLGNSCIFEEGDVMELICHHGNSMDSHVTFSINNVEAKATSLKRISESEIQASFVAGTSYNFATCKHENWTSQRASLHVLAKPTIPEVVSCQRVKINDHRESEESFQCHWKPQLQPKDSTHKNPVVHQLFWKRMYLNEENSPDDWRACPDQEEGSCTWSSSSNSSQTFFSDDDGSTEGWENCVVVVAHNKIDSEGLVMKNHTSDPYCFSMTAEPAPGLPAGAVAGITLGVVFTVLLIVGAILFYRKQKKSKRLKIEIPKGLEIQLEDTKDTQNSQNYYASDIETTESNWRDSWMSSVATPSTANSTAPLLNSDPHHFSFSNAHGKNYSRSKLPNDKSRVDKVQTKDQTDLIMRLLVNNNDHRPKEGITYAVIKNTEVDRKLDTISENKNGHQSAEGIEPLTESQLSISDYGKAVAREGEEEDVTDGMYTIDIPWSEGSNPIPGAVHSAQSGNSVTSYTVIAPSPTETPRHFSNASKRPGEL